MIKNIFFVFLFILFSCSKKQKINFHSKESVKDLGLGTESYEKDTVFGDYLFKMKVNNWNRSDSDDYGKAKVFIEIINQKTKKSIQTITSDRCYINESNSFLNLSTDYNFDGINDLTLWTGTKGAYGATSFDIYLFNKKKGVFILNRTLEEVTYGRSFEIDKKRKWLISYNGSGDVFYQKGFVIDKNDSLKLVKKVLVKQLGRGQYETIERELINNTWKEVYKTYSGSDKAYQIFDNF